MNFVALALLEASSGDDENAFWILVGMCDFLDLEVSPPPPLCAQAAFNPQACARGVRARAVLRGGEALVIKRTMGPKTMYPNTFYRLI